MHGSDWTVGMEVVFVGWPPDLYKTTSKQDLPEMNKIYVIREICLIRDGDQIEVGGIAYLSSGDALFIRIDKCGFCNVLGFRRLQKRKTSIELFKKLLIPTKREVEKV